MLKKFVTQGSDETFIALPHVTQTSDEIEYPVILMVSAVLFSVLLVVHLITSRKSVI